MRDDGKTARPHPDDVMAVVEAADPQTEADAVALNDQVRAMTEHHPVRHAPRPIECSHDGCRKHATVQEARDCPGCDQSEAFGDPHNHPHYDCHDHEGCK